MKLLKALTLCTLASTAIMSLAQSNNIVEEVVWWIGDQPIYRSDVEEMYLNMRNSNSPIDGNPYCVIPEQIAIDKLFLHQADIDTVEVQEGMVAMQVEAQINMWIDQLGSREKVEQMFHRTIPEMRETLLEMRRNDSRIREVQRNLTKDVKATPSDVRRYFSQLPEDSIPFVPLQVEVQILTINPTIPREEIDAVKDRLRDYSNRINKGESDFSTLAIMFSEDPGSSMKGGETGFMGRAALDPEYAAVAFNLNDPKKVSKIVESEYGFHIIQLIEKRGDRINTRHILLRPRVSDKDLADAMARLDTLRNDILAEKFTLDEAIPHLSQDKDTRNSKGMMVNDERESGGNRFYMSELPQDVSRVVNDLSVGEISKPFIMRHKNDNREFVAIVKLVARIDGHRANLSEDYQMIKGMYENSARNKIINNWVANKIKDTYVRIEDGWRDCEFKHSGWIKTGDKQ